MKFNIIKTIFLCFVMKYAISMDLVTTIKAECLNEAYDALAKGNLQMLDALVGDTACHARVPMIISIYKNIINSTALNKRQEEFIMLCRMLTKSKHLTYETNDINIKLETSDYKQLNDELSKGKGIELIKKSQTLLSSLTVKAIQEIGKEFNDDELSQALEYTKLDNPIFKRLHTPCYPTSKVVLLNCLKNQIPLIIKVNRLNQDDTLDGIFYFMYAAINDKYTLTNNTNKFKLQQPVIVIEGFSSKTIGGESQEEKTNYFLNQLTKSDTSGFIDLFCRLDIMNVFFINAAAHSQYSGKALANVAIPFTDSQLKLKEEMDSFKAKELGFSKDNKAYIFLIDHIFADTLGNILNLSSINDKETIKKYILHGFNGLTTNQDLVIQYLYGYSL